MILYAKHGEAFQIDEEDYYRVSQHNWYLNSRYIKSKIKGEIIYLHIFLLGKAPKGLVWDHIDRDSLNNQKLNLRTVTPSENSFNRNMCWATSRFQGIYIRKSSKGIRWETYLPASLDPKKIGIYLGINNSIDEALDAQVCAIMERGL